MNQQIELLSPAGSFEILKAVIAAGADAVYVGGGKYGARAYASNFSEEELIEAIHYVHLRGKKLYLTVNTLLKNSELGKDFISYLTPYYNAGLDAVLVQDIGVLTYIHKYFPDLPIHASTQMTVTSKESALYLKELGVERVVVSRELSLDEMKEIYDATHMELEAFVHGALCYSYSGMCLFSSLIGGRSGNRGRCAQPCRLPYSVFDAKGLIKEEQYMLSLKDNCGIDDIQKMIDSGVCSLKIEGRMKQLPYAYGVTSVYANALHKNEIKKEKLLSLGNRGGFTNRYYYEHNHSNMITYQDPSLHSTNEDDINICEMKLPIYGYGMFVKNEPAMLTVTYQDYSFTSYGNTVEAAKSKPISEIDVKERIQKTGQTDFYFDQLELNLDLDIFVPNGAINQLRRDALEGLKNEILNSFYRNNNCDIAHDESDVFSCANNSSAEIKYVASVMNHEQLNTVLDFDIISDVYLDLTSYAKDGIALSDDILKCKSSKKHCYLRMPDIIRMKDLSYFENEQLFHSNDYDGFVVNSWDSYALIKRLFSNKQIIADYGLYSMNNLAVRHLSDDGCILTAPLELNKAELKHRDNSHGEIIIYGRYPLMQTANCVCKNSKGCKKQTEVLWLQDRKNARIPVINHCNYCYNTIYNSAITNMIPVMNEISVMGFSRIRFNFTTESSKDIKTILMSINPENRYNQDKSFTYGHYKRGVE